MAFTHPQHCPEERVLQIQYGFPLRVFKLHTKINKADCWGAKQVELWPMGDFLYLQRRRRCRDGEYGANWLPNKTKLQISNFDTMKILSIF